MQKKGDDKRANNAGELALCAMLKGIIKRVILFKAQDKPHIFNPICNDREQMKLEQITLLLHFFFFFKAGRKKHKTYFFGLHLLK